MCGLVLRVAFSKCFAGAVAAQSFYLHFMEVASVCEVERERWVNRNNNEY